MCGSLSAVIVSPPTEMPPTLRPVLETIVVTMPVAWKSTACPLFACTCAKSPRNARIVALFVATALVNEPDPTRLKAVKSAWISAGEVPLAETVMPADPVDVTDVGVRLEPVFATAAGVAGADIRLDDGGVVELDVGQRQVRPAGDAKVLRGQGLRVRADRRDADARPR